MTWQQKIASRLISVFSSQYRRNCDLIYCCVVNKIYLFYLGLLQGASSKISGGQDNFNIVPDLVKMAALMCQQRKGMLRERHHLKQAYEGNIENVSAMPQ